jgi:hypothetical protein
MAGMAELRLLYNAFAAAPTAAMSTKTRMNRFMPPLDVTAVSEL